jgi:hypothetical protein
MAIKLVYAVSRLELPYGSGRLTERRRLRHSGAIHSLPPRPIYLSRSSRHGRHPPLARLASPRRYHNRHRQPGIQEITRFGGVLTLQR